MTRPIQLDKTYGVLHTENYFSFLGFAKKVGSDEIQKIDVYLDDKLIDTIQADKFIQKIDDMYDVESKAFKYNLPSEHIGKKAILSFKNHHSGEELLNSPYTLIDKNHEDFNEAKFLHSLSEPLSEELINMYKPNCVGFLATKENLEDEDFLEYIYDIQEKYKDISMKLLVFNKNTENILPISLNHLEVIEIKTVFEIQKFIKVLILNLNNILDNKINDSFFPEILYISNYKTSCNKRIQDSNNLIVTDMYLNNNELFNISKEEILEYKNHFTIGTKLSLRNTSYENNDESFVDENQTINERELNLMSIAINSQTFIKNHCNLRKKIYNIPFKRNFDD